MGRTWTLKEQSVNICKEIHSPKYSLFLLLEHLKLPLASFNKFDPTKTHWLDLPHRSSSQSDAESEVSCWNQINFPSMIHNWGEIRLSNSVEALLTSTTFYGMLLNLWKMQLLCMLNETQCSPATQKLSGPCRLHLFFHPKPWKKKKSMKACLPPIIWCCLKSQISLPQKYYEIYIGLFWRACLLFFLSTEEKSHKALSKPNP